MNFCKNCEKEIQKYRTNKKFCSEKCQMAYWHKKHPRMLSSRKCDKCGENILNKIA